MGNGVIWARGEAGEARRVNRHPMLDVCGSCCRRVAVALDGEETLGVLGNDGHGEGDVLCCCRADDACWLELGFLQRKVGCLGGIVWRRVWKARLFGEKLYHLVALLGGWFMFAKLPGLAWFDLHSCLPRRCWLHQQQLTERERSRPSFCCFLPRPVEWTYLLQQVFLQATVSIYLVVNANSGCG